MSSGFSSLHPALTFTYFMLIIVIAMLFMHPLYLSTILLATILINLFMDSGEALKSNLKFYLIMAIVIMILNPIFSQQGSTILLYFRDRPVTLEAAIYGVLFALLLLNILITFLAYNQVITSDRFLFLFASVAPKTAFNLTVVLRFIPLMKRRLQDITAVQKAMGGIAPKTTSQRAREAMQTLNILVTWSLEAALQTAVSMRARGYGLGQRSSAVIYPFEKRDLYWLIFLSLTGGASLAGAFLGYGQFEVYPHLGSFGPVMSWHYLAVLLFLSAPIYIEGKECLQWRIIRSRI